MNAELEKLVLLKGRDTLPKVLLAAAECSPLSKTGGLADVAGALPKSLNALGFDARVITPYHRCVKEKYADKVEHMAEFYISLGWRRQYVGLEKLVLGGLTIYLIDSEYYFGDKIYRGGLAEGEQYAYFQRAVLEAIPYLDFVPEVLHCNDWHTAFLPFLIKTQYYDRMQANLKTVFSIHNIAFQGQFGFDFVADFLGVDSYWYNHFCIEHHGCVNFMKSACVYADKINTVSPSYAEEIKTPEFGEGMQEPLIYRGGDLSGIINGLDIEVFDPETDPDIPFNYSLEDLRGKASCKLALIEELGLEIEHDTPIVAMVTRMTSQKGFDIVLEAIDGIVASGAAFVLLGSGDARYEKAMRECENRHRGKVCAYIGYSEALSHRIYAGADFLLMPSAFEPCGLSQMIAMRYGTLPIVHEVGGLRDTVQGYNEFTGEGNGFSFAEYSGGMLYEAVRYALEVYADHDKFENLRSNAMSTDFGFGPSAIEYGKLFVSILDEQGQSFSHDPFEEVCRMPLGALACGRTVKLTIKAPDTTESVSLAIGGKLRKMKRRDDRFEIRFTAPEAPCVLWYHFETHDGICFGPQGLRSGHAGDWQMTVYDASFETPEWFEGKTMYQIFPDRFARGGRSAEKGMKYHRDAGREIEFHEDWSEPVKWQGRDGKFYCPNDFYGGTLAGITEKLDYLKDMGVDVIYLNPIFEADSNHRYNTGDYKKIDPILGSLADFKKLREEMDARDMRLILDGVFSHTGDDSIYFNKYGRYGGVGAYQSEDSLYHSWYDFKSFPDKYRCWWNFETLPEVNELDKTWQSDIITGRYSVVKTWLRRGAGGWRLDVADELPDEVIELIRSTAKAENGEALVLGEVWEDATTKESYGTLRSYALGRGLDSVMNYPLRRELINFALGKTDAKATQNFLLGQKLNYPAPMYRCLMNLLGSHDTARIRSVLALGYDGGGMERSEQVKQIPTPEQDAAGKALQRLCAAIIFALPGMPAVYYGDEEGMKGLRDPFCRAPYVRREDDTREYYRSLANMRRESSALSRGDVAFAAPDEDTLCILRFDGSESRLCCVNRGKKDKKLYLAPEMFSGAGRQAIGRSFKSLELDIGKCSAIFRKIK